jgi:hypothetical protein
MIKAKVTTTTTTTKDEENTEQHNVFVKKQRTMRIVHFFSKQFSSLIKGVLLRCTKKNFPFFCEIRVFGVCLFVEFITNQVRT